jgi:mannose/fructose/N-acetylgalactosamine-specific phosphotransferase system component IIC
MLKDAPPTPRKLPVFAAAGHGFFCLVIGLWPVVSFDTFQSVAGHMPDRWLLSVAGMLLAGIGIAMLVAAIRRDIAFEVYALGLITSLSLAATDILFVIERSIPLRYLLDGVAESLFVTLWVFAIRDTRRSRRPIAAPAPPTIGVKTEPGGIDGPG